MPSISPFITYETLHCVHQYKRKDEPTSNPQNNSFNDGVPKKIAGFARLIKLPKPVPESKKNSVVYWVGFNHDVHFFGSLWSPKLWLIIMSFFVSFEQRKNDTPNKVLLVPHIYASERWMLNRNPLIHYNYSK